MYEAPEPVSGDTKRAIDEQGLPTSLGDRVTWDLRGALRATAFTISPLLALAIVSAQTSRVSALPEKRLPLGADIASGFIALLIGSLGEAIFLVAPLYFARKGLGPASSWRQRLSMLGLRRPLGQRVWLLTLGAFVVALALSLGYDALISALRLKAQVNSELLLREARVAPVTVIGILLMGALVAPLCEEVFFRGFLTPGLGTAMGALGASVVATLIFAVAHFDEGSFVPLVLLGGVIAYLRVRTGSILPGLVVHVANNVAAAVTILLALRA